jgi:hypothetical protein
VTLWQWLVELVRRLRVARLRALNMEASSGAYSVAGFDTNLTFARRFVMQTIRGIFQWSGFNVNLTRQKYTLQTTRGLFAMTGRDATFTYTPASTLGWSQNIFPMTIERGSFFDLASRISGNITEVSSITANTTLPSGVAITNTPSWRVTASSGATLGTTSGLNLTINATTDAGWTSRISGPSVVWYHNFDSAAEVNQFRWSNGYSGGNDPLSRGTNSQYVTHVATGGADGGGFMRIRYPQGVSAGTSHWWRPLNALTGATNGRGINDPGASGTITPLAFNASDGSSTLYGWSGTASNGGWYAHSTVVSTAPSQFQGTDFYVQLRIRRAQAPGEPPDSAEFSNITGKSFWLTTSVFSNPGQELVTYGHSAGNNDQVGVQPKHRIYVGQNFGEIEGQANATVTVNNNTVNWRYSGGWDTLLYHITPGTSGGTGTNRTRVEAWAQHDLTLYPSESGTYTKIWDVLYTQDFTTGTNSSGSICRAGWNAILLSSYHNGAVFTTMDWQFDYDQIIFSKATIAAPTS